MEQEAKHVEAQIQQLGPRRQALEAEARAADATSRATQAAAKEVQDRVVGEVPKTLTGHPVDEIARIVAQDLSGG